MDISYIYYLWCINEAHCSFLSAIFVRADNFSVYPSRGYPYDTHSAESTKASADEMSISRTQHIDIVEI